MWQLSHVYKCVPDRHLDREVELTLKILTFFSGQTFIVATVKGQRPSSEVGERNVEEERKHSAALFGNILIDL
jgi:hypothetical protein